MRWGPLFCIYLANASLLHLQIIMGYQYQYAATRGSNETRRIVTKSGEALVRRSNKYDVWQQRVAGDFIISVLNRSWFDGLFDPIAVPYLTRLAFGIFVRYQSGLLLKKKDAMVYMNTQDGRTFQRYIQLMEEKGLITVSQSKLDRRVDWLCPTPSLLKLIERELAGIANEMRFAMAALLRTELPNTGAPSFVLGPNERDQSNPFPSVETLNLLKPKDIGNTTHSLERDAIEEYSETIRLAPTNAQAFLGRGIKYSEIGEHQKAVSDLTEAIRLESTNADFYQARAQAYYEAQKPRLATSDMREMIKLDSENWGRYKIRADFSVKLKEFDQALEDYQTAIRLATKGAVVILPLLYYFRAAVLNESGDAESAIRELSIGCALVSPYQQDLTKKLNEWKASRKIIRRKQHKNPSGDRRKP